MKGKAEWLLKQLDKNFRNKLWVSVGLLHKIVKSKTWTITIKYWIITRKCRWNEKEGKRERRKERLKNNLHHHLKATVSGTLSLRFKWKVWFLELRDHFCFHSDRRKIFKYKKLFHLMTLCLINDSIKINVLNFCCHFC